MSEESKGIDYVAVGSGLRDLRIMRGLTQTEVAELSGLTLSTVFHVERGDPVRLRTLMSVCGGMGTTLDDIVQRKMRVRSPELPEVVHRYENTFWRSPVDLRKNVPADNALRITDPAERLRLGRLGLVPVFAGYLHMVMPEGPGAILIELYSRYSASFNSSIYRESLIYCQKGGVRLQIGEGVNELKAGDFIGYASAELRWLEPVGELPAEEPAVLLWTGAVRIGTVLKPGYGRTAVRKPRAGK